MRVAICNEVALERERERDQTNSLKEETDGPTTDRLLTFLTNYVKYVAEYNFTILIMEFTLV